MSASLATRDRLDVPTVVDIGVSAVGRPITADPSQTMVLVAGSTGSGKTTLVRWLVTELARVGYQVAVLNPKYVGYEVVEAVAHVVTDPDMYVKVLQAFADEMERRYLAMAAAGLSEFQPTPNVPRVALVVEEVAALTATSASKRERDAVMQLLMRYAHMARGAGMTLVLVTQSPDAKTIDTSTRAACGIRIGGRNGLEQWSMLVGSDEEAMIRSQSVTRPGEILVSTPESYGWVQGVSYLVSPAELRARAESIAALRGLPRTPAFLDFQARPDTPALS